MNIPDIGMKNQNNNDRICYYHNECKNDVIKIISYIQKFINHPESNTLSVVEHFMNNTGVFDNIIKHFSVKYKKMSKLNPSLETIMVLCNYVTSLINIFNTVKFKYLQPCKLQYDDISHLLQYNRISFEKTIDFVNFSLSYFKEMHINLLKIILSK